MAPEYVCEGTYASAPRFRDPRTAAATRGLSACASRYAVDGIDFLTSSVIGFITSVGCESTVARIHE